MITQTPLEKQVISLDLSGGMDERQRPELLNGVSLIENLVQDQTGAWVKRNGLTLGPLSDASGTGTYPAFPRKIVRLINGWAVIADKGHVLHKMDNQNSFRQRQQLMDFNVTSAIFSGSAGPRFAGTESLAFASASCSTHDAIVASSLSTVVGGSITHRLTITERATGLEYTYNLGAITYPGTGGAGRDAKMVFVADRYLHLYVANNPGTSATDISLIVIDVLGVMPANEAAIVNVSNVQNAGAGGLVVRDACGSAAYSYCIVYDGAVQDKIYQRAAADGASFASYTPVANTFYRCIGIDETNITVWLMDNGAAVSFEGLQSPNIGAVNVARFTSTHGGTYFSCDPTTTGLKVVYVTTSTFGSTTLVENEILTLPTNASVDTTVVGSFNGWTVVSKPFFVSRFGKHYIQLTKFDPNSGLSSNVLADISTFTGYVTNTAGLAKPYGSVRIACVLEPFAGIQTFTAVLGIQCQDGDQFSALVPYQTAARTLGYVVCRLRSADYTAYGSANFGGCTYIAHGGLNCYDGRNAYEQGMVDMPNANNQVQAVAGNLNGSYKYVVVYRHVDANGNSTFSRTFGPISAVNASAGTGKNLLTIQQHAVTNRDSGLGDSVPFIEVYRTLNGGTQYFICATSAGQVTGSIQQIAYNATTGLATVTDNLSDATLSGLAIMYRQPGTTNAPADRYAGPSAKICLQHKDRLFCVDGLGQRVYYSSFFVDGESAWFNPTFNFFVHAGSGPITGLASMDGRLFIFKRDVIFVVDGDGPGEAGPSGNEFSPPQALSSSFGCIDHRSIVSTPDGIVYRSGRGIEMITRNLQVKWIGDKVQSTCSSNPVTTGASLDNNSRVHILVANSEAIGTGVYVVDGAELVFDMSTNAWSVFRHTPIEGTYGRALQNLAMVKDSGVEKMVYADNSVGVWLEDATVCTEGGVYVPWTITSGWIHTGPLARQRLSEVMFFGLKDTASNHALTMSIAHDYSASFTQTKTWQPDVLNGISGPEVLDLQPSVQQVLAVRLKLNDGAPSDIVTYPVGTGRGCDAVAVSAEIAQKLGAPRLAAGQKA